MKRERKRQTDRDRDTERDRERDRERETYRERDIQREGPVSLTSEQVYVRVNYTPNKVNTS